LALAALVATVAIAVALGACSVDDGGEPHLGFDAAAAKRAIRDHGFYAFELRAEERDGHD